MKVRFNYASLRDVDFTGADLSGARIHYADFLNAIITAQQLQTTLGYEDAILSPELREALNALPPLLTSEIGNDGIEEKEG